MSLRDKQIWKTWTPPQDGEDLFAWQGHRCAWCGHDNGTRRLVRDHCHFTGLVRGYLCSGCNSREGVSFDAAWDAWRAGDNPAFAFKFFEVYRNQMGATPITSQGALHYYSHEERLAWFELIVPHMEGGAPWPEDAPWIETATARRDAMREQFRNLDWSFLMPSKNEAAS